MKCENGKELINMNTDYEYKYDMTSGIGIKTNKIVTTAEKVRNFIETKTDIDIRDMIMYKFSNDTEQYENCDLETICKVLAEGGDVFEEEAIAQLIAYSINKNENITLWFSKATDGNTYLICKPLFGWEMTDEDKNLTYDILTDVLKEYLTPLTDQTLEELDFDHHSIKYDYAEDYYTHNVFD